MSAKMPSAEAITLTVARRDEAADHNQHGIEAWLARHLFRAHLKAWGTLNWLRPDVFSSFWRFADEHWGTRLQLDFQGSWRHRREILGDEDVLCDTLRPYYSHGPRRKVAPTSGRSNMWANAHPVWQSCTGLSVSTLIWSHESGCNNLLKA